jgi:PKD repeat protein
VTLTASNAGGSTTSTQTVLVSDPPVAQFDVAADELDVSFTDLSSNGPTTWSWDFGDGTTSTSQSPTHEYESAGTYLVTLVASNTVGESAPSEVSITVARRPRARFDYEENGLSVTFEDRSTREPTSWLWDFGDGTTSTSQNPTHIYEDRGRYDVVLTVANVAGTDDTDRTIRVQERPPEAKFSCGIVGSSVACDGSDSTNVVQWQWFSDEAIVIANGDTPTPVFTYLRSGVYEITLVVTNSSEDTDSLTKDSPFVEVPEPPTIQTLDVVSNVDGLVELSASASQSPTGWSWTAPGATFVSGQNSDSPVLRYNSEGQKTVTAIASNGIGDSDPVQLGFSINLILPPVITNVNVQPGLPGKFTVSATATNSPDSWSWNMPGAAISGGDGPNPTFTFNANGIYNGSVVASNEDGSSAPFPITITVNNLPEPPVVTSVVEQSNAGGVVTMLAVATNNPTGWQWQMTGDINTQGENTASATFTFDANGTYGGRVRAANGAGIGPWNNFQVTVNDIVVVPPPPTAGFTWGQVSQVPPRVDFTDASSGDGPLTYTWDFGGGTGDTAASSPTGVTFPAAGSYTVTLTVTDGFAQSDSTSSIVDVTEPPPDPDALPPAPDQDPPVP